MTCNHKLITIILLLLAVLLSTTIISASDNISSDKIAEHTQYSHNQSTFTKTKLEKNEVDKKAYKTGDTPNAVYVGANGDSASEGNDISHPTTLTNALTKVENNGTIVLTANQGNVYNISENITNRNVKSSVTTFSVTAQNNTNIILSFNADCKLNFTGKHNINLINLSFTRTPKSSDSMIANNVNLTLNNCSIYSTNNNQSYGAVYNTKTLTIINTTFYNNTALSLGAAVYTENATVDIKDSRFEENNAENGAVTAVNSRINVDNSEFISNKASFGAVFSILDNSRLTVTNSTFSNNTARYYGGVLDSWYSRSTFNNSRFISNTAECGGVTYCVNNLQTTIQNSLLENNHAHKSACNVYSFTDNLDIYNNAIIGNNTKNSIYCQNSTYNLDNNWWGVNNPNFSILTNNILPNNWRLMTVNGETSNTFKTSINTLSDSNVTSDILYNRRIVFSTSNGSVLLSNDNISESVINRYDGNLEDLHITIDQQSMTLSDKVKPYLNLEDISVKRNEQSLITVKCNPDITTNITIKVNGDYLTSFMPYKGIAQTSYLFDYSWTKKAYNITASIADSIKYEDTTAHASLTIYDVKNTSVVAVRNGTHETAEENVTIKGRYDLDTLKEFQTSVKDQGKSGSCWAFSALSTLESAYLKAYGIRYNFSENNMKNQLKKFSLLGDTQGNPNEGNGELQPISYLVGWYGPVNEEDDLYNQYSIMSPYANNTLKVEDVYFFYRSSATGKDNKKLKEAIMKYGALSSSVFSSYAGSSSTGMYTNMAYSGDHAISIVGWNDFYSNFYGSNRPEANGAYVIKNSWGESIGDGGYQYVSYYDTSLAGVSINSTINGFSYAFPVKTYENYTNIYQHDTISTKFIDGSEIWAGNVYTARNDESVAGVGTYILDESEYEAYVYVNDRLCYHQEGNITQPGYRIIKLDKYIQVKNNDVFRVNLKIKTLNGDYARLAIQDTSKYKSISGENMSFVSTDGKTWRDLYTSSDFPYSAAVLKAYTKQTPVLSTVITQSNKYTVTTDVYNLLSGGKLSYKVDDEYYRDADGNIVYVDVDEDGNYSITIPYDIHHSEHNLTIILETPQYTVTESTKLIPATKVSIYTVANVKYVDEEQRVFAQIKTQNNTLINEGTILITEKNKVIKRCPVTNGTINTTLELTAGNHNLTLTYYGPEKYQSDNTTLNITLQKHEVNMEIITINSKKANQNTTICTRIYSDNNTDKLMDNAQIYIEIDGIKYHTNSENGEFNITHFINRSANYTIQITYAGNETYQSSSIEYTFTTEKENTTITMDEIKQQISTGENITITGTLTDSNGIKLDNESVSITFDKQTVTVKTVIGKFEHTFKALHKGINNITVTFNATDVYNSSEAHTSVTVKEYTAITINHPKTLKYNDTLTITGNLTDRQGNLLDNQEMMLTINGDTILINTVNGHFNYTMQVKQVKNWEITVIYRGNDTYNPSNITSSLQVFSLSTSISLIDLSNVRYEDNITVKGNLTDENGNMLDNQTLIINIGGIESAIITVEGQFTLTAQAKTVGNLDITVIYSENQVYEASNATCSVQVTKLGTNISLDVPSAAKYGNNVTITGYLTDANGNIMDNQLLLLKMDDDEYSVTTVNGYFNHTAQVKRVGKCDITVLYAGNTVYEASNSSSYLTIYKLDTQITINATNTVKYGDNITIYGKLTDQNNNPLKSMIYLTINNTSNSISTDNMGIFSYNTTATTVGKLEITVSYDGNDHNNPTNNTTTVNVLKKDTLLTLNAIETHVYDDILIIIGRLTDEKNKSLDDEKIILTINTMQYNLKTKGGTFNLSTQAKTIGQNNIAVIYEGSNIYSKSNTTGTFTVQKQDTQIDITSVKTVEYADNITIMGFAYDKNKKPLSNTILTLKIFNQSIMLLTDETGTFNHRLTATDTGTFNMSISYDGDMNHNPTRNEMTVLIHKKDTMITINTLDTAIYGDIITITGQLTDNQLQPLDKQVITIKINDESYDVTTDKGLFKHTQTANTVGINTVTVTYNGNNIYAQSHSTKSFNTNKQQTNIRINSMKPATYGQYITVTGKLTDSYDDALGNMELTVIFDGRTAQAKTDNDGAFTAEYKVTNVGNLDITVKYDGNAYYNQKTASAKVMSNRRNTQISVKTPKTLAYADKTSITGKLTSNGQAMKNTTVHVIYEGADRTVKTNNKGIFTMEYKAQKVGNINITVKYDGNAYYNPNNDSTILKVLKKNTRITINTIRTLEYHDKTDVTGKLTTENGNILANTPIRITYNNIEKTVRTNSKGTFKLNIMTVQAGKNIITVKYSGDSNYNSGTSTATFTVTKRTTQIIMKNIGETLQEKTITITGRLTSKNNIRLANTNVYITVNTVKKHVKTAKNGVFKISYKTTVPGTNNITVTYRGNKNYVKSTLNTSFMVTDTRIELYKIKATAYKNNYTIRGKLTDKNCKIVKNAKIELTINNKTVTTKTNSKGVYSYRTRANTVGTNTVEAKHYSNTSMSSATKTFTVTKINTSISINRISKVKANTNIKVTGKLSDSTGTPLKNTRITVNANGKNITVKTNTNGTYTYTFKSGTTGNKKITVSYAGNAKRNPSKNSMTVKVV